MPTLKKFFCLLREFWKPVSRASSKNLKYFQGKYLWSVTVVKPLSLRFTLFYESAEQRRWRGQCGLMAQWVPWVKFWHGSRGSRRSRKFWCGSKKKMTGVRILLQVEPQILRNFIKILPSFTYGAILFYVFCILCKLYFDELPLNLVYSKLTYLPLFP